MTFAWFFTPLADKYELNWVFKKKISEKQLHPKVHIPILKRPQKYDEISTYTYFDTPK